MSTDIRGHCACGTISFRAALERPQVMACYCKDCQRATGSPMATFVAVPESALEMEGQAKGYTNQGESGRSVTRFFCPDCGSQLYSSVEVAPGVLFVKLGSLDQADNLAPQVHIWTASRPSWCQLPDGAPAFDKNPPPR